MISNKPELIKKLKKSASKIGSKKLVDAINNSADERAADEAAKKAAADKNQ